MLTVNAGTEIYAILGDPISHSLSPVIINKSFERLNMDKIFLGLRCEKKEIDNSMRALKSFDFKGYTFTMPLKEVVEKHLDELKSEAFITGAVNCVKNSNGYLTGYNTDSVGFWTAIQEKKTSKHPSLNKLFIFGMGGFSKAAVTQAALQGIMEIVVTNHFEDKIFLKGYKEFLKRLHKEKPNLNIEILPWEPSLWKKELRTSDIVVNATPNGQDFQGDLHLQVPYSDTKKTAIFFDAIYNPLKTKFLETAEEKGYEIIGGLDLLVHQGVCSFEIWTGKKVDPGVMKKDALQFLQKQNL